MRSATVENRPRRCKNAHVVSGNQSLMKPERSRWFQPHMRTEGSGGLESGVWERIWMILD